MRGLPGAGLVFDGGLEMSTCPNCHGEGTIVVCCDDMCRSIHRCIHGDGEIDCPTCEGEGELFDEEDWESGYEEYLEDREDETTMAL